VFRTVSFGLRATEATKSKGEKVGTWRERRVKMIFKFVILCALASSPALGSSIKGYSQLHEEVKGQAQRPLLVPVEQQKLVEQQQVKTVAGKLEHVAEQRTEEQQPLLAEHKAEELHQQREEARIEEPAKSQHFEARPQVSREELKGQTKYEQQREELQPAIVSEGKFEQRHEEQRIEQQREFDGQQVELKQEIEQGRLDESQLVQSRPPILRPDREQKGGQQHLFSGSKSASGPAYAEAEPYAFSYQVDGSSRSESGDTRGVVRGQYTLQGSDGASRVVDYIADHNGFRASVNTNEFGTEARSPANVALRTSQPSAEEITLKLEGKSREELAAQGVASKTAVRHDNWSQKGDFHLPLAPIVQAPVQAPLEEIKGTKRVQVEEVARAPAKGQRLVHEELPAQQLEFSVQEPVKSAEVRTPKAIASGELKLASQPRSASFESATAHRAYKAPPSYAASQLRPAPGVLVRAQPATLVRAPVPAVSRTYLQREPRYPPSPVQGYRRHYPLVEQPHPRVSFYGPSSASFDDEQPSFEHADS